MNGMLAGMAGVTPASGFIPPYAGLIIGILVGLASYYSCEFIHKKTSIEDVLDVFTLQAVPGLTGALLIPLFCEDL